MHRLLTLAIIALTALSQTVQAKDGDGLDLSGLKWRNLGPAFMSGRISDIDWDPEDSSVWYVAAGSGGVWKTENAGVSWTPIFDNEASYSIGNVTVDPLIRLAFGWVPERMWVADTWGLVTVSIDPTMAERPGATWG
jgi:hypothetical protein